MSGRGAPPGWRTWFAPTGTPPAWPLVRYMTAGLLLGLALSATLPQVRGALLGGLTGLVVAAAGLGGAPSGIARRVALVAAAASLVLTVIALAATYLFWPHDEESDAQVPAPA